MHLSVDPTALLPHRPPFLFLDEITAVTPELATGVWRLPVGDTFFAGNFRGQPTTPGVVIIESLAQLGGFALLADERFAGKLPLFAGIDRARFRRAVAPGDTLELSVQLRQISARSGKGHGKARLRGETACEADLMFVIAPGVIAEGA
jgi:3-hydroxyacyl-[acyl-carrier-protein] dehydratase